MKITLICSSSENIGSIESIEEIDVEEKVTLEELQQMLLNKEIESKASFFDNMYIPTYNEMLFLNRYFNAIRRVDWNFDYKKDICVDELFGILNENLNIVICYGGIGGLGPSEILSILTIFKNIIKWIEEHNIKKAYAYFVNKYPLYRFKIDVVNGIILNSYIWNYGFLFNSKNKKDLMMERIIMGSLGYILTENKWISEKYIGTYEMKQRDYDGLG